MRREVGVLSEAENRFEFEEGNSKVHISAMVEVFPLPYRHSPNISYQYRIVLKVSRPDLGQGFDKIGMVVERPFRDLGVLRGWLKGLHNAIGRMLFDDWQYSKNLQNHPENEVRPMLVAMTEKMKSLPRPKRY